MKILTSMAVTAAMLFIASCTAPATPDLSENGEKSLEQMRAEAWEKIDKQACAEKGGEVRQEGMMGMPRCVIPYSDAGELCSDSSDCEGKCLASDDVTDSSKPDGIEGRCEANDSPFGCYMEILGGRPGPALCVD